MCVKVGAGGGYRLVQEGGECTTTGGAYRMERGSGEQVVGGGVLEGSWGAHEGRGSTSRGGRYGSTRGKRGRREGGGNVNEGGVEGGTGTHERGGRTREGGAGGGQEGSWQRAPMITHQRDHLVNMRTHAHRVNIASRREAVIGTLHGIQLPQMTCKAVNIYIYTIIIITFCIHIYVRDFKLARDKLGLPRTPPYLGHTVSSSNPFSFSAASVRPTCHWGSYSEHLRTRICSLPNLEATTESIFTGELCS